MVSSSGLGSRAHLEAPGDKKYRISKNGATFIEFDTEGFAYELLGAVTVGAACPRIAHCALQRVAWL